MATPTKRVGEEISATGERATGAAKEAARSVTGQDSREQEGQLENARERARQAANQVSSAGPSPSPYVTGFYREPEAANRAYEGLRSRDYLADDIDVVMSDDTRRRHFSGDAAAQAGSKAVEGLGVGGAVGGGVGAALAAAFAVGGSVVVPGLGLVVAGPIAAALAGAGAGAATGGLIGALVGAGIPEDRARAYEKGVREGGVVLGTRARDAQHAEQLREDFRQHGGTDILPPR